MDATATPRGISLAVGELGARGRPINKQCTAVRISSTVNGDMCGTCQADLLSLSALARDARNPRLLFPHPPSLCVRCRVCGVGPATASRAEQWSAVARVLQAGVEGPFPPLQLTMLWNLCVDMTSSGAPVLDRLGGVQRSALSTSAAPFLIAR